MQRIAFVAGKSGGHIVPALVLLRKIRAQQPECLVTFFSTGETLDTLILSQESFSAIQISCVRVPNTWWRFFIFFLQFFSSFIRSFVELLRRRPQYLVSMGGVVSVPVCLAAWVLRIPITLYELNAIAGRTVKFMAPYASHIKTCFHNVAGLPTQKTAVVPYPLRFSTDVPSARVVLGIPADACVLLVLGGSQGSVFLNQCIENYVIRRSVYFSSSRGIIFHQ